MHSSKQARMACLVLGLALLGSVSGCKDVQELDKAVSVKLDPSLRKKEMELLRTDVRTLAGLKFEGNPSLWYGKAFGTDASAGLKFLDTRVNYILSERVALDSRLTTIDGDTTHGIFDDTVVTMAVNVGAAAYMIAALDAYTAGLSKPRVAFKIGKAKVPVLSTRVGIIQLGEGYTPERGVVTRVGTLIHEARHSDCPKKFSDQELAALALGVIPRGSSCGNTHAICPAGHEFEGYSACDGHAWGSYAIEGVFQAEVASRCTNCTEAQKQAAVINAMDSYSRVLDLNGLLAGKYGDPDMTTFDEGSLSSIRKSLQAFKKARETDLAATQGELSL